MLSLHNIKKYQYELLSLRPEMTSSIKTIHTFTQIFWKCIESTLKHRNDIFFKGSDAEIPVYSGTAKTGFELQMQPESS